MIVGEEARKLMRSIGPKAALAGEVIDFYLSDRLLSGVGGPEKRPDVRITNDLRVAIDNSRNDIFPVDPGDGSGEDLEYYWGDLLENLTAELIYTTAWYDWETRHKAELSALLRPMHESTLDRFAGLVPKEFAGHIGEEVWYVLTRCAQNRAYNGQTDNFWEQQLRLYLEGLWPCGWEGRWPSPGRFVAWRRESSPRRRRRT